MRSVADRLRELAASADAGELDALSVANVVEDLGIKLKAPMLKHAARILRGDWRGGSRKIDDRNLLAQMKALEAAGHTRRRASELVALAAHRGNPETVARRLRGKMSEKEKLGGKASPPKR